MPDAGTFSPNVAMARNRWRAAEDRLYPTLIADPGSYQRSINAIQAVVAELRKRCTGVEDIIAVEAAPEEIIAAALPGGSAIPTDLLLGVACGMADREISSDVERRRREAAIEAARAEGRAWVVVSGPETAEELTDGRRPELHLPTGTIVEIAVDPWSGEDPFQLQVTAGETGTLLITGSFTDRDEWLAEIARQRAAVEAGTVGT
ncbi:MAG: hypothetical protein J0I34_10140 [Pseudonocardia sp.]|uniref:hypothetical protein n=1 Tax=unclassified Pseudonocardia TaxID=2619320 RepID=UPI00086E1A8C|nr:MULTISPECIES: hypothetical protein [unclassified Pseudonocardia]MBN9109133.1 hypothetical protein [Pseudonocardia sp.]ODV01437.1 MAG: hypothetical protein ABT15_27190 [Pseudonocardia sp. SCN 73-27]